MVRVRVRVGFYHEPKSAGAIDTATFERSRTSVNVTGGA